MISLTVSIVVLVVGYFVFGKYLEKIFGMDEQRNTPAVSEADGIDFVVLPYWKIFLIQFLNIAGLGPIFGAVAGALWGPSAFLWIVFGSLFAGGVHDYFAGMLSVRNKGLGVAEISGKYLGNSAKYAMRIFTLLLMVLVGAVFVLGPANILSDVSGEYLSVFGWTCIILIYYILSTILPIDKLIGKLYPIFGLALIFMTLGLLAAIFVQHLNVPELTLSNLNNQHYNPSSFPLFPMLFVTIACGAISGFHATQSPIMARCMSNEKQGKGVFYGAMLTEGIVALVWAAISMSFFGNVAELNAEMLASNNNIALIVNTITSSTLGKVGGFLALLGVVAAPITSGDTSFRSARLIVADFLKLEQRSLKSRLLISVPLFLAGFVLIQFDFGVVWRYFAWTNQVLATMVLWTITVYLREEDKNFWISLIPALFMTSVVTSYILVAPEGFGLDEHYGVLGGLLLSATIIVVFFRPKKVIKSKIIEQEID